MNAQIIIGIIFITLGVINILCGNYLDKQDAVRKTRKEYIDKYIESLRKLENDVLVLSPGIRYESKNVEIYVKGEKQ